MREAAEKKLHYYGITTKWFGFFDDPQVQFLFYLWRLFNGNIISKYFTFIEKQTSTKLVPTYA